jgi:hypothetical protein
LDGSIYGVERRSRNTEAHSKAKYFACVLNLIVEGIVKLFSDKEELVLPMFSLFGMTCSNEILFSAINK